MEALKDPEMKEILEGFCQESDELFEKLEEVLEDFEDDPSNTSKLEEYGQIIDRIMGAAKSIGLDDIGKICELGKIIGYKSSQAKEPELLEVVSAVLFDALEILRDMNDKLKSGDFDGLSNVNSKAFKSRMKWISDKFKDIQRSSCDIGSGEDQLDQDDIDKLMNGLGL